MTISRKDDSAIAPEELYRSKTSVSHTMNLKAQEYLPGGDSRSTIYYLPYLTFFAKGEGCWLYEIDGNRSLDFTRNHTRLVLGYSNPDACS